MRLIDTHSHIHDAEFDADRDAVIARATESGVELVVTLGVDSDNSRLALALAERSPVVFAAVGIHPHEASEATELDFAELEAMSAHPRVAFIGEIGLDFYRNLSSHEDQKRVLRRQLSTASRAGKPVSVHSRLSDDEMVAALGPWSAEMHGALPDGRPLGVMHYFSGDVRLAQRYIELGFMISIHTSITHPKASSLIEVARQVDLDHLVLETDSPYGAPQRLRGKRNEPAFVADTVRRVAELKGVTAEAVAAATTVNAQRLLGFRRSAAGAHEIPQTTGLRGW